MSAISERDATRTRRAALAASVPVVIVAGLAARFGLGGTQADIAGGVAYTALVYVLVALAGPHLSSARVGLAAYAISAAIELFQLTPVPADLGDWLQPLKLVFGSTFAAIDLVAYALGALLAVIIDARFRALDR